MNSSSQKEKTMDVLKYWIPFSKYWKILFYVRKTIVILLQFYCKNLIAILYILIINDSVFYPS